MGEPKLGVSFLGGPMHYSAGAFIKNNEGKYLLVDRKKPPFGFAGIAGHIDDGEDAYSALVREVKEESGLVVRRARFLEDMEISNNKCRHGIDKHYWFLFECECAGTVCKEDDGAHSIGWYSPAEVERLAREDKLEPVWKFWFTRYNIISAR